MYAIFRTYIIPTEITTPAVAKCNFNVLVTTKLIPNVIGYADTYMEDNDYNCTFPENTKVFLENYKKNCSKEITAICDVYEDLYIPISVNDYKQVLLDVVDYFGFKLSRLFTDALSIPDVTGIRPITNIKLKDGSSVNMRQIYVPNCELDYNTLKESWKFEEIPAPEKSSEE